MMRSSSGTWRVLRFAAVVVVAALHHYCFTFFLTTNGAISSNETDRMALLQFKSMITSDPLGALGSWNDSTQFCNWNGVLCSKRHGGRVTILDLRSKMLSGSISAYVGNLIFLRELNLLNNSFSNKIPPEIGRLRRLQQLALLNNSLNGEIPSNITACSALTTLNLANNELVGRLPWQIGSLSKLQLFVIAINRLTGSIPPFGNLSSLQTFQAFANNFSGTVPDAIGRLTSLQTLNLQRNNLSGEIPPSVFNISSLTDVYFGGNRLHGNLPMNLGLSLPNLQSLDVAFNQFTGSVPSSLTNASSLVILQLQVNNLTGTMPSMESSINLVTLYIYGNSLGSWEASDLSFISSLTNASSLKELFINRNNFGGSLPEGIGNLTTGLEQLSLRENEFSGSIPSGIQNLVNLQVLDAGMNKLSGTIPWFVGKMQALQWLDLGDNTISGSIPSSLGNLTKLLVMNLFANNLQGGIPSTIENCQMLIVLDISYNNLTGFIPPQVMSISSLSIYLNLSHNHLVGALPNEVGSLENLGSLDLSYNMLSGEIPSSLGSCIRLESLNLQGNGLQGTIPSSLSSLRGIQRLDISDNNLSGQIPNLFEGMKQLQLLNLSYNSFEGEVPSNGVFANGSIISVAGNNKLCGGMNELNLPPCNFKHDKKTLSRKLKIVISTVSSLLLFTSVGSYLFIFWIRKRGKQDTVSADDLQPQMSYHSLYKATDGFSKANLIGMGSFGSVYKGILEANGTETTIAVKVFNLQLRGASKSFMAECAALKNIRHRNLVRILTVCSGVDYQGIDFKALIYEFMANGNLEDWLHPVETRDEPLKSLNFLQRLNVATDVAFAMDYLHYRCGTPIVHCDLKPSNVLLDEDMTSHVSDFGLARFLQPVVNPSSTGQTSSSIGINGTVGYAPPEYGTGNEVSMQGDVYSYGILLLEIFTGKSPTDETFREGLNIYRFVRSALSENLIAKVVDPILLDELLAGQMTRSNAIRSSSNNKDQMLQEVLFSILEIGVACSSDLPHERISISEVVARLVSVRSYSVIDLLETKGGKVINLP